MHHGGVHHAPAHLGGVVDDRGGGGRLQLRRHQAPGCNRRVRAGQGLQGQGNGRDSGVRAGQGQGFRSCKYI